MSIIKQKGLIIKTIHLTECTSTQEYLKELVAQDKFSEILVSSSQQNSGVGRTGNEWIHFQNSIAFSFTLKPMIEEITLTSMEMGVLLVKFFQSKYNCVLYLKWPNDLLNFETEKCGGILINALNLNYLVVGIGININIPKSELVLYKNFKTPCGSLNLYNLPENYTETLPLEIYKFILDNRLSAKQIIKDWNELCIHNNRTVKIVDRNTNHFGIFRGLGENGEAVLEINSNGQKENIKILNGSLFLT